MSSPSRRPGSDTRPARATRAVRPLSVCRARRPPARGSLERRAIMLRGPPPRARRVLRYSRVLSFVHPSNPCTLCASADDKNRGPSNSDTRTATDRPPGRPAATARLGGRGAREDARTNGRTRGRGGWRARSSVTRSPRSRGRGGARCRRDGRRGAGRAPPVGRPRRRRRADAR